MQSVATEQPLEDPAWKDQQVELPLSPEPLQPPSPVSKMPVVPPSPNDQLVDSPSASPPPSPTKPHKTARANMLGSPNVLIATLKKNGYDLDYDAAENADGSARAALSSSSSILQLRERKNNQTAFHIAAKKGHSEVLKALGKLPRAGDYVNIGDRHGNTALHFAASCPKPQAAEMVDVLVNAGANMDATNVRGQTPLAIHILTVREDSPAVAKVFGIKQHALNTLQTSGTTYLHMALERNLIEVAGALIAGGASINVANSSGVCVSDLVPKKQLIRLCCFMREGTQTPEGADPLRKTCQLCKEPKGKLDSFKMCMLCGRTACKNCSKKVSEIPELARFKEERPGGPLVTPSSYEMPTKNKDWLKGRYCTVCCTVRMIQAKHKNEKKTFQQKMYGCGTK